MIFESLHRLGSKASRVLVYPEEWDTRIENPSDRDSQLLVKARDWYAVRLIPADIPVTHDRGQKDGDPTAPFVKFMAWSGESYDRVLHLDSDITIIRHVDELFLLPNTPVAMMRDYAALPEKRVLASNLILLQPSGEESDRLAAVSRADVRQQGDTEADILNRFYGDTAMVLPHQTYGLRVDEFRAAEHRYFIGNTFEHWEPEKVLSEVSLVHFIDDPFPKPWVMWPHALYAQEHPKCNGEDCSNKDIWTHLYDDFRKRRKVSKAHMQIRSSLTDKDVCALLSAPAPEWPPRNNSRKHSAS
ncbi:MAG: hypothetical protein Q9202_000381 [Teloschistes flavicans]